MAEELFASLPNDGEDAAPDAPPPDNRRGARQVALQALYWETSSPGEAAAALRELGDSVQRIREAVAPYTRFVRVEREKLERLESELKGAKAEVSTLRVMIEELDRQPATEQ